MLILFIYIYDNNLIEMDEEKFVIRGLLRHYWKKGLSAKAAAEQICEVEGADSIHRNTAAIWFKRFNEGDTSLADKDRSGRPPIVEFRGYSAF
jgi:transposase